MSHAVVGEVLLGRYRVTALGELGGAAGADAVDTETGKRVRLVVASLDQAPNGDVARALVDQERYALGAPGLARALSAGLEAGVEGAVARVVAAFEGRAGSDLATLAGEGVAPDRAAEIARGIARAIAPLHDQGMAHGLLRPDLITVTEHGVVVDGFGVEACLRAVAGTRAAIEAMPAAYRAPERAGGGSGPATPAADLFALGTMVRELVGESMPDAARALLEQATARSPVARPTDVTAFAEALRSALTSAPPELASPLPEPKLEPEPRVEPAPAPREEPKPPVAPQAAPPPAPPLEPAPVSKQPTTSALSILALVAGLGLLLATVGGLFAYAMWRAGARSGTTVAVAVDGGPVEADAGPAQAPEAGPAPPDVEPSPGDGGVATFERDGGADAGTADQRTAPMSEDDTGPLPVAPAVPLWGSPRAAVTVLVFGDLECPHTRRAYAVLEALTRAFPDDLRVAWRHRPLSVHPHAREAARVAAGLREDLGDTAFWRFLSELSRGSDPADRSHLERWVSAAGGDPSRITTWLSSADTEREVSRDLTQAALFDVRETPTFFINGLRVEGYQGLGSIKPVVDRELAAARGLAALGTRLSEVYTARVRKNLIGIGADVAVRTCPPVAGSPVRGNADALVTIVEFADFECPFCRRAQPTLDTLLARFGGDVRLVWKNFPLDMHADARPEAAFALEAYSRGGTAKFWRVHDLLFQLEGHVDDAHLSAVASQAGLDPEPLLEAAAHKRHDPKIDGDVRLGKELGVKGTPSFFINGRQLVGAQPVARFQSLIQDELENARRLVASGTPRSRVYDTVCRAR